MLSKIYDSLLSVVYPQACQICAGSVEKLSDGAACGDCWEKTRIFSGAETLCGKCGKFLQAEPSDFQAFCHTCDEHFYDEARAVGFYELALAASVISLKREPFIAGKLQKLFFSRFQTSRFHDSTRIIPVPLSKKRQLERGFNQAAVLAELLAGELNLPLDGQSLARVVHTPMHRAAMDTKAREASVKNVFEVKVPGSVKDETILLIDDVFTSGATVSASAKVLKEKGARRVYVLTVARAY